MVRMGKIDFFFLVYILELHRVINVIDNIPALSNLSNRPTMTTITTTSSAVILMNDHEISNEDSTWQAFKADSGDASQPASIWSRIHRIVKDALGYTSNSTVPSSNGVAIPDPYNA